MAPSVDEMFVSSLRRIAAYTISQFTVFTVLKKCIIVLSALSFAMRRIITFVYGFAAVLQLFLCILTSNYNFFSIVLEPRIRFDTWLDCMCLI
jgi:hypothetical protein